MCLSSFHFSYLLFKKSFGIPLNGIIVVFNHLGFDGQIGSFPKAFCLCLLFKKNQTSVTTSYLLDFFEHLTL